MGGILQIGEIRVATLRRIVFASIFVIITTVIGVLFYSGIARLVSLANGEPTLYPRLVPPEFDIGIAITLDLCLSLLTTAVIFYGIARTRARSGRPVYAVASNRQENGTTAMAARLRSVKRYWLLLAWLGVQLFYDFVTRTAAIDGPFAYRLLEALGRMTTPLQLFTSFVALVIIWKEPWRKRRVTAGHNGES